MNSSLKTHTLEIEIKGVGKTRREAVNNAFGTLSREATNKIGDEVMIYMRPLEVSIVDTQVEEKTERFLFLFLPRKKQKYKITLLVKVEARSLAIEE